MDTRNQKTMIVRPKSAGGKFPDGAPVLPTIHFEGSTKKKMTPQGSMVPRSSYYLRLLHSKDLEEITQADYDESLGAAIPEVAPIADPPENLGFRNHVTADKDGE